MANVSISGNPIESLLGPEKRCGLLVSVRNTDEAKLVLRCGVEVLDLKEPLAGALGAVPDTVVEQVQQLAMQAAPERRPKLSFALGELAGWDFQRWPRLLDRYTPSQIAGFSYVKIGLAGVQQGDNWPVLWSKLFAGLPDRVQPVVGGYLDRFPDVQPAADDKSANGCCPSIGKLIEFAKGHPQVSTVLLDTHDKQNDLFAHIDDQQLREIIAMATEAELAIVVAGSVTIDLLPRVIEAGASLVGVRGAVCEGDRSGRLCEQKLREFRQRLKETGQ